MIGYCATLAVCSAIQFEVDERFGARLVRWLLLPV